MSGLVDQYGQPLSSGRGPRPRGNWLAASYDAAATTRHNTKHWAQADALGPLNANRRSVRERLRRRSRYEALESNSYAAGIVETLANDTIGTGPVLNMRTGNRDSDRQIERAWMEWSVAVDLAGKLRLMRLSKIVDGEAFCRLANNENLPTPCQLDLLPLECDLVTDPQSWLSDTADNADGVFCDARGYPTKYRMLRGHPGDAPVSNLTVQWDDVPAAQVLHLFARKRAGQLRGIPEITPALPLFALLRAFTLATLGAAEQAANLAGVMKTTSPNVEPDVNDDNDFFAVDVERNSLLTLPAGWDIQQLKSEHPATTYEMFKREILNEIARCLHMPFNIAACNSSSYNYASGRLDHQTYYRAIRVERSYWESRCLEAILRSWLAEYLAQTSGIAPSDVQTDSYQHAWWWMEAEHVDPVKESTSQDIDLGNGSLTLAEVYGRRQLDWEQQIEQRGREIAAMRAAGIPIPGEKSPTTQQQQLLDQQQAEDA